MKLWMFALLVVLAASVAPVMGQSAIPIEQLRSEIKQTEDRLSDRIEKLESVKTWLLGSFVFSLAVIGGLYWRAVHYADRRAREEIDKIAQGRGDVLNKLIDDREKGRRLRAETEILVVADAGETGGLLQRLGFKRVVTTSPDEARTRRIEPNHVVVFDVEHGCSDEAGKEIVQSKSLDFVLAYKRGNSSITSTYGTFANSPVTLFTRLTELLDFRAEILK